MEPHLNSITLTNINENYVKDFLKSVCYDVYEMYLTDEKVDMNLIVNDKIKSGLSSLLSDWKLETHKDFNFSKSEKRENLISHIIEGVDIKHPPVKFRFHFQLSKGLEIKILDIICQL